MHKNINGIDNNDRYFLSLLAAFDYCFHHKIHYHHAQQCHDGDAQFVAILVNKVHLTVSDVAQQS